MAALTKKQAGHRREFCNDSAMRKGHLEARFGEGKYGLRKSPPWEWETCPDCLISGQVCLFMSQRPCV